jgi:plastocyanin
VLGALLAAVLAVAPASAPSGGPRSVPDARATQPVVVTVRDTGISPSVLTVPPGTTIVFHNAGALLHRLMSNDGSIDTRGIEPGGDAAAVVGAGSTEPLAITVTDEVLPGVELAIRVVPGAAAPTSSTPPTTAAPPSQLAHTGSSTMPLLVLGLCAAACGLAVARAQRRALRSLAFAPSGRDHTSSLQRRHDDVLPESGPVGPAFSRGVLGTRRRARRP